MYSYPSADHLAPNLKDALKRNLTRLGAPPLTAETLSERYKTLLCNIPALRAVKFPKLELCAFWKSPDLRAEASRKPGLGWLHDGQSQDWSFDGSWPRDASKHANLKPSEKWVWFVLGIYGHIGYGRFTYLTRYRQPELPTFPCQTGFRQMHSTNVFPAIGTIASESWSPRVCSGRLWLSPV